MQFVFKWPASTISSVTTTAKEIVMRFIDALNAEDFKTARMYASDDMKFTGMLGPREGADAYMNNMEKMKLKYKVQKYLQKVITFAYFLILLFSHYYFLLQLVSCQ
jgi:hypothetical protein